MSDDTGTRVLLHVVTSNHPTVRSCATAAGTVPSNAYRHLHLLRDDGLVDWEDGQRGTLRACVRVVPLPDDVA